MSAQSPSRQRWLIPVLVVVLSVTVAGGLVARELYHTSADDVQSGVLPITVPSSTSPGSHSEPGSGRVEITPDVAGHPAGQAVLAVLQNYFDALNAKNYALWRQTVTTARIQNTSQSAWHTEFRSTKDGSILVYRIEEAADDSLSVLVGFTSTQSINEAPANFQYPCIRWRLELPMRIEGGGYRIDIVQSGSGVEHERC
ncbi:hypothetical protein [Amycolatopsis sulphurea]|uniref:hypothetical protein n=1 Tax=Amycolatopsis sulphurea TaxID=76022 RepID=UPI000BF5A1B9|nr:hypothetical protein [Amycolatopsis sulphurea]